jgi:hypothetical protein
MRTGVNLDLDSHPSTGELRGGLKYFNMATDFGYC